MTAYILTHSPAVKPDALKIPENPAQEIVDNLHKRGRALTDLGGWNITVAASIMAIKPEDLLFFYRTKQGSGIFAVGRALPYADDECLSMRREKLEKWYDRVDIGRPARPELAAYPATNWKDGKGKETTHINAEWERFAIPGNGPDFAVLVERDFHKIIRPEFRSVPYRRTGTPALDSIVESLYRKCGDSPNAFSSR